MHLAGCLLLIWIINNHLERIIVDLVGHLLLYVCTRLPVAFSRFQILYSFRLGQQITSSLLIPCRLGVSCHCYGHQTLMEWVMQNFVIIRSRNSLSLSLSLSLMQVLAVWGLIWAWLVVLSNKLNFKKDVWSNPYGMVCAEFCDY